MADPAPAPAPAAEPKKGGLPTILLIVNAVLMVGVLGAVVMMLLKKPAAAPAGDGAAQGEKKEGGKEEGGHGEKKDGAKEAGHGEKKDSAAGVGPTLRLADFVVHLRNPESDRYARFSFEVEVASEADKIALTARQAQLRDAFIIYLSDRTAEDLRGSGGLEQVKAALLAKAVEMAKDAKVRQLYVTDFVMQ